MMPPVFGNAAAAGSFYGNLKQFTGPDAGACGGNRCLGAGTNRIVQTDHLLIGGADTDRSGQIGCIALIVAAVINTDKAAALNGDRLVNGVAEGCALVGRYHAEDVLCAAFRYMTAEIRPQILLCVTRAEVLQAVQQGLLGNLRRAGDPLYLLRGFYHAGLIEHPGPGDGCVGKSGQYPGGGFVRHTAGVQRNAQIGFLGQLAKRIHKRLNGTVFCLPLIGAVFRLIRKGIFVGKTEGSKGHDPCILPLKLQHRRNLGMSYNVIKLILRQHISGVGLRGAQHILSHAYIAPGQIGDILRK